MLRKTLADLTVRALASRPISAVMQPFRSSCVPVLMLHRIADPVLGIRGHPLDLIEQALAYLRRHRYTGISIQDLVQALIENRPLPPRAVAFTLDDGFQEQAELALPLFERYRMPVTLFLATNMLDKQSWSWDYQLEFIVTGTAQRQVNIVLAATPLSAPLNDAVHKRQFIRTVRELLKSQPINVTHAAIDHLARTLGVSVPSIAPLGYQAMTWDQARALESKYIHFGPHTCNHIVLTQLSDAEARAEIAQSWQRLQDELSHPVPVFCYPTGRPQVDFGSREKRLVQQAGMIAALSSEAGYIDTGRHRRNDLFALRRFSFTDNISHFIQYCSWIERAKELTFHKV
ncbi:polysaccharide deacetylase family protein [Reinekea sp.]|jgi:peptidoglycan/xylan/chitin deacetylase (PgdA/CDA1 family)|uniref:polysaccharide deacetylase family protein n=1 Tax=Reinekea sp. TaxID=1970455 RepID=UPI002A81B274|nr:polysaccharide deacetylase family protein [Reinekea sp.]